MSYKWNIIFPHVHLQVKLEVPCFEVVNMENLDFGESVYDEVNSSSGIIGRDEFCTSPEKFSEKSWKLTVLLKFFVSRGTCVPQGTVSVIFYRGTG